MLRNLLATGLICHCVASVASAEVIRVPQDYPTIKKAVKAAHEGDTVLVADGVYRGSGNKNVSFGDKNLVVRSEHGPDNCVIDRGRRGRGFILTRGQSRKSVIEGFTILNGTAEAIYCKSASPTIRNCVIADSGGRGIHCEDGAPLIANCTIRDGGGSGIYSYQADPVIIGCTISGNREGSFGDHPPGGGGISCWKDSNATITDCTISANWARDGGGGIYFAEYSTGTITNCNIFGNTTADRGSGGGIRVYSSNGVRIILCVITENSAGSRGGGIHISGSDSVRIVDCVIRENSAGLGGGGISCDYSALTVTNSLIAGNLAPNENGGGGGVNIGYLRGGTTTSFTNCIITQNQAAAAGGVLIWGLGEKGDAIFTNCIIAGNNAFARRGGGVYVSEAEPTFVNCTITGNSAAQPGGALFSRNASPMLNNCVLWGNVPDEMFFEREGESVVGFSNVQGGWPGEGNIDANPRFVDPENDNYRLGVGSPCIDAADNFAVPRGVTTDLDGLVRFHDDPDTPDTGRGKPPIVDMGAYEFGSPPPCTGADKLRAKCRIWRKANRIKAIVRHGQPGAVLTFRLDADPDSDTYATVTDTGQARVAFKDLPAGRHVVELIECDLRRKAKCP